MVYLLLSKLHSWKKHRLVRPQLSLGFPSGILISRTRYPLLFFSAFSIASSHPIPYLFPFFSFQLVLILIMHRHWLTTKFLGGRLDMSILAYVHRHVYAYELGTNVEGGTGIKEEAL